MDWTSFGAGLALGALAAGVAVWLAMRGPAHSLRQALEDAAGRLKEAEGTLAQATGDLQALREEAAQLRERTGHLAEAKARLEQLESEREGLHRELADLKAREAAADSRYEEQLKNVEEQRRLLDEARAALAETFKALSADTLAESRGELRKDAEDVLKPLRERLEELQRNNEAMDQRRAEAYGDLKEQLASLAKQQAGFQHATATLARALQDTGAAGAWGEMVLERVLEMGGLVEGIHFETQSVRQDEAGTVRPDVVVKLPGERTVVIDSKAPLRSFMSAQGDVSEAERAALLADHAAKLLGHARALGSKGYAKRSDTTDFVVLFVPSEAAFRAAYEHKQDMVEEALAFNVFIATPTTLLALIRAVAYGWRQEQASREARKIQEAGQKLYESVGKVVEHFEKMGRGLRQAVGAYNELGASLDTRMIPRARQMKELGVQGSGELEAPQAIEFSPRSVASLAEPPSDPKLFEDGPSAQ